MCGGIRLLHMDTPQHAVSAEQPAALPIADQLIALADTADGIEAIGDAAWVIVMANKSATYAGIERRAHATWVHLHGVGLHAYIGDDGTRVVTSTADGYSSELRRWTVAS